MYDEYLNACLWVQHSHESLMIFKGGVSVVGVYVYIYIYTFFFLVILSSPTSGYSNISLSYHIKDVFIVFFFFLPDTHKKMNNSKPPTANVSI